MLDNVDKLYPFKSEAVTLCLSGSPGEFLEYAWTQLPFKNVKNDVLC